MPDLLRFGDEGLIFERIRAMLGVGPYEPVEVRGSVTEREDGKKPYWIPATVEEFNKLRLAPVAVLRDLCLVPWDKPDENGMMLWLFPAEWYEFIPEGYEVVSIRGVCQPFVPGKTVNEQWSGCLPYGFMQKEK